MLLLLSSHLTSFLLLAHPQKVFLPLFPWCALADNDLPRRLARAHEITRKPGGSRLFLTSREHPAVARLDSYGIASIECIMRCTRVNETPRL